MNILGGKIVCRKAEINQYQYQNIGRTRNTHRIPLFVSKFKLNPKINQSLLFVPNWLHPLYRKFKNKEQVWRHRSLQAQSQLAASCERCAIKNIVDRLWTTKKPNRWSWQWLFLLFNFFSRPFQVARLQNTIVCINLFVFAVIGARLNGQHKMYENS